MTRGAIQSSDRVDPDLLMKLTLDDADWKGLLVERNLWTPQTARQLAEAALQRSDEERENAAVLLSIASDILSDQSDAEDEAALVYYVQARFAVQSGELAKAENMLLYAQRLWRGIGNSAWLVRSNLGLSQVLTMQGRYAEAETAIRSAIEWLEQADQSQLSMLQALASAQRNLANVLMYQERHSAALAEYHTAESYLMALADMPGSGLDEEELNLELAHIALNRANALTFLDKPTEAEAALLRAIELFDACGDVLNRGRSFTNLGRLYLREGRFAAALDQFDRSALDLIGEMPADAYSDVERLRQADELLLEHANAYLALNLFQEASSALERCEALFRSAEQPFELSRTRYTQGLLRLYRQDYPASRDALEEARRGFEDLGNRFWANRTSTAIAALEHSEGSVEQAANLMEALLQDARLDDRIEGAISWDIGNLAEARLLYARLLLETGRSLDAQEAVEQLANEVGLAGVQPNELPPIPHLYVRLEHLRGRIELMDGNQEAAQQHLRVALDVMERQRATLPLEEIRTAFLDDKTAIYGDLILAVLERSPISSSNIGDAFDIAERARSRSLLERIQVTIEDDLASAVSADNVAQRDALRREVHWLYNQMLEEPGRLQDSDYVQQLQSKEAALQKYEWRTSPLRMQAEPVKVGEFQRTLRQDRQALVYYVVRDKVMAFVVSAKNVDVYGDLCSADELAAAQSELRFQLGRVELGEAYLQRHGARLHRMVRNALERLYDLLVEPIHAYLTAGRILVIPYGSMHLLPFHAFWDGNQYLLQRYEFSYAPSASLAVHCQNQPLRFTPYSSFAGLAVADDSIPEARSEVIHAAKRFADAQLYLDDEASRAGLEQASSNSDILHVATHGLFRPDNSFFSALKLADGWIDVREIYRLPLSAQLVVLSACESGAGEIRGADEVIGLARGFIGAGVNSLVVSLWNVHDATSAEFMERFYENLISVDGGQQPSAALRAAQLEAIADEQHPYYWAPFTAVG